MARSTSSVSAALHTDGLEHLAFWMILAAMGRSAVRSTYTWQLPQPVSMTGTRAFWTTDSIRPLPPRGMSTSRYPVSCMSAVALSRLVSCTRLTQPAGRPTDAMACRMSSVMAWLERKASLPPRRITALPALRHSAAASTVTLGRAS